MGVSKAFRGAMAEARKNIEHLQTPAASPPIDQRRGAESWNWEAAHRRQDSRAAALEDIKDLQTQVGEQEKRSKILGKMLDDALKSFRSAQEERGRKGAATNGQEKTDVSNGGDNEPDSIEFLLARIQFVQIYLENPTLPVSEVDDISRA